MLIFIKKLSQILNPSAIHLIRESFSNAVKLALCFYSVTWIRVQYRFFGKNSMLLVGKGSMLFFDKGSVLFELILFALDTT